MTNKKLPQSQKQFSVKNIKLTCDSRSLLEKQNMQTDNFALKLNKYVVAEFNSREGKEEFKIKSSLSFNFYDNLFNAVKDKSKRLIELLNNSQFQIKSLELNTQWRLIVGLGLPSIYETSIALHHIFGIPYIPGSSIKGIVRGYIISEVFNNDEAQALKDSHFVNIFGNQKQQGKIIFLAAYPVSKPHIKTDVMTPHFSDYYSGNSWPADYLSPNPIIFLTVEQTKFNFTLAAKNKERIFLAL